jgi:hypothetical protein
MDMRDARRGGETSEEIFRAMQPTKAPFFRSNGERGDGRSEESFGGSETQKKVFSSLGSDSTLASDSDPKLSELRKDG